jgi:hypothetical protein
MNRSLLAAVSRFAEANSDADGLGQTPVAGLTTVRATAPSGLLHAVSHPLICLVLQGSKEVATATQVLAFGAGDSLLITADVPVVSQITEASAGEPYLSLVLKLEPAVISDLAVEMEAAPAGQGAPVRVEPTDAEVADAAWRLMKLLERPDSLPVLHAPLVRELHYWLLAGHHGPAIRRLGGPEGHTHRIAHAVRMLRAEFAQPLRVDRLAAAAGMSASSFYQHFRAGASR